MLEDSPRDGENEQGSTTAPQDPSKSIAATDIDFSGDEVEISNDATFTFDRDHEITLKRLKITGCSVEIKNLNMKGTISIYSGKLTLVDSDIHDPDDSIDYIISVEVNGSLEATRCNLQRTRHFGVCVDTQSTAAFTDCVFREIQLFGIVATGLSKFNVWNSKFIDMESDCLIVTERCSARVVGCEFTGKQRRALSCNGGNFVLLDSCHIHNCAFSSLFVSGCEDFALTRCKIVDCHHTSVYLDKVVGVVEDTVITGAEGNGVNVSHCSRCLIKKCQISKTMFPPIAICEGSFGRVKKCEMTESQMCGLIVRGGSKASVKGSMIKNVRHFGISASDSKDIKVDNCLVMNCGEAAIASYNSSEMVIKNSNFATSKVGINVFTGGFVHAEGCLILGMTKTALWVHHAGSASFTRLLIGTDPFPKDKELTAVLEQIDPSQKRDDIDPSLVSIIESKRRVVCTSSCVIGMGSYELVTNDDVERAKDGRDATPAICKVCGTETMGAMYDRCGHIVYCKKCWDALETKPELCEICHLPVTTVVMEVDMHHEDEEDVCAICFTDLVDSVILPCGHTICSACASQWFSQNGVCPFCREKNVRAQKHVPYQ